MGLLGIFYFIFLTLKRYYLKNPTIYFFMLFLVLIGLLASLARSGFGVDQAFSYRYRILSITMGVLIYISLVELVSQFEKYNKVFAACMIFLSMSLCAFTFNPGIESLSNHKGYLVDGLNQWVKENSGLLFPDNVMGNAIMVSAL